MLFFDKKKKILVTDNDNFIHILFQAMLEKRDYELLAAVDGAQCIEIARKKVPDLIIMDLMMPGVSGLEAVRTIRADPKTKNIPILVCTVLDWGKEIELCLQAGANDYIIKPFDENKVRAAIEKLLELPPA